MLIINKFLNENKRLDRNQIKKIVVDVICDRLNIKPNVIKDNSTLVSLGADSLDITEITLLLEEKFNKEIPNKDSEKLTTVKLIVDYIYIHQ